MDTSESFNRENMVLNKRLFRSIKLKVFVTFIFAGSIPMIISMIVINNHFQQALLTKTKESLMESAGSHIDMLEEHINAFQEEAAIVAELPSIKAFVEASSNQEPISDKVFVEAGRAIAIFQNKMWGEAHYVFLVDQYGTIVLNPPRDGWVSIDATAQFMRESQGPHISDSIAGARGFKDASDHPVMTDFFGFTEESQNHQFAINPVKDEAGITIGFVAVEVSIDFVTKLLKKDFAFGETGHLFLATDQASRVVPANKDLRLVGEQRNSILEAASSGTPSSGWFTEDTGRKIFGVYQASQVYPWVVCVEIDQDEIKIPLKAQQRLFLLASFVSVSTFAVVIIFVGRMFWRPLNRVVAAAERVADGDLWHEIEVTRSDEIGLLESAVDSMRFFMKQQIDHLDALVAERTAELEYANEKLEIHAEQDELTGLANRQALRARLVTELGKYHEDDSHLISVLFFDFDRFKVVNDSLGHAAGDALLCSIADRFGQELRNSDLAARFGGDEFVVIISSVESPEHMLAAADRLLKVFGEPHVIDGHRIVSTASIGLVIADARYTCADDMIRDADAAMYEAKLAGKDQIVIFDEQMFASAKRRLKLEEDLNMAIENNELRVMYQPIIGIEDMNVTGFEALIRWEHPELGMVGPDQFIPIAEDTGQIVEIGAWILREAVEQLVRWDTQYGLDGSHSINVNVAKRQLIHPEFLGLVQDVLESTGIDPSRLKVEITESTAIDPRHDMGVVIKQIRALGVLIAMDDFGTGHSSLSLLHKFDFDILKIDQSFVQGMEKSRDMSAVFHAIIALAQNTGMQVVAEGAETKEQVICLISHGCDMVQGYYFAKPLKAVEAGEMLIVPIQLDQAA